MAAVSVTVHFPEDVVYHWHELPQVSFLLRQKFCCEKDNTCVRSYHKYYFCRNKTFVATKIILVVAPTNEMGGGGGGGVV